MRFLEITTIDGVTSGMSIDVPTNQIEGLELQRLLRMAGTLLYGEPVNFGCINVPLVDVRDPDVPDVDLARRLTQAFHRAVDAGASVGDGLWEEMRAAFHTGFLEALYDHDYERLAVELANMFSAPISSGLAHCPEGKDAVRRDPMLRILTTDAIAALGMSLGIEPTPNPFLLEPSSTLNFNHIGILEQAAEMLGHDLAPPQVGGIFGVEFRGKLVPLKYLYQIYMAKQVVSIHQRPVTSILEIGGGVGFLAYACLKMGVTHDYCVIDLPQVNVLQGYLLLKSEFARHVQLFGEDSGLYNNDIRIRLLPDVAIHTLPDKSFEVAVNQDSFPEMASDTMAHYLAQIVRLTQGHFLSINQESMQQTSPNFVHGWLHAAVKAFPELNQRYRMRYWMRPGYVEELFEVVNL